MSVEFAQNLLQELANALLFYGGAPEEPAPPLTSWEEFLKPPTAEERAAAREAANATRARRAAAHAASPTAQGARPHRAAPTPRAAADPGAQRSRRRRRRGAAQTTPRPAQSKQRAASKPGDPGFMSLTYDVTAPSSGMEAINTSAPRAFADEDAARAIRKSCGNGSECQSTPEHVGPTGAREPRERVEPPSMASGTARLEGLSAIRKLLEQVVRSQQQLVASQQQLIAAQQQLATSQQRTNGRLDRLEATSEGESASEPVPATRVPADSAGREPTGSEPEELTPVCQTADSATTLADSKIFELLLALTRQIGQLTDRVNEIERRSRISPSYTKPRRARRSRGRPGSSSAVLTGDPRGPPGRSAGVEADE